MIELVVDAFKDFECIGDLCEDTCCGGWNIAIDKSTYDVYKKSKNKEFKELFEAGVYRVENGGKYNYAKMNLNSEGRCFFLDDNKLCNVYKLLGPDKMSEVCSTYPRYSAQIGNVIQKTLVLSCPEVCRKVLLRKEPIEFNISEIDSKIKVNKIHKIDGIETFSNDLFVSLRSFLIEILQNRNYSIPERLAIIGLFVEDIEGKDEFEIVNIGNKYVQNIIEGSYSGICDYIDNESILDNQVRYFIKAYSKVLSEFNNGTQIKNVGYVRDGLRIDANVQLEDLKQNLNDIKSNYYNAFIAEYEYVFENYLVNYAFKSALMLSKENLFNEYGVMVMLYSMIKFGLIGLCGYFKEDMDESRLISYIASFTRGVDHSPQSMDGLNELVEDFKTKRLAGLMSLIVI